ncbi:unnamed protein product [Albugo candida]|uniref:Uncharacterized protein n=1 Tax=Albugo candida TaxID=65357 RepID=A0A024FT08_9STRA|nr:unnamed protein product [Albugo candida]|eukprot:CCI10203.1 unnamed protein product [Albugo candida]
MREGRERLPNVLYLYAVCEASGGGSDYLLVLNNIGHASQEMRIVPMAKVDDRITEYPQQEKELTRFAQAWESGAVNNRIGSEVVSAIQDRRCQDTRRCDVCGEMDPLRATFSNEYQREKDEAELTLAIPDVLGCNGKIWILDCGSSRHLAGDKTWLDDLEGADGTCAYTVDLKKV